MHVAFEPVSVLQTVQELHPRHWRRFSTHYRLDLSDPFENLVDLFVDFDVVLSERLCFTVQL